MHEMSLVAKLLTLVEHYASQQSGQDIHSITVEIGTLMAVDKIAFQHCFAIAKKNSIACRSELKIIDISATAECANCQQEFFLEKRYTACPGCGDFALLVKQGDQMRLLEMELK